jgi:ABC-type spermidine/putrescine transport system permease subunit II
MTHVYGTRGVAHALETAGAWLLGFLWLLPLLYAVWTAFHPAEFSTRFALTAPLTLENFEKAWIAAPFARYFLNTMALVTMVLAGQLVLVTLAAYAFARFDFPGRNVLFALVLVQLMVMPDVLIVENYQTMTALGLKDTVVAIALPYMASAFGIFSCGRRSRQFRASWTKPPGSKGAARSRSCGRSMCRSRAPSISRTRSSASATTGTIFCGRSSLRTRWSRGL